MTYLCDDLSPEETERQRAIYGPLTDCVRELVDACIRTQASEEEISRASAEIQAITARLRSDQLETAYGVAFDSRGLGRHAGNTVLGLRNPVAPPLRLEHDSSGDGRVFCELHLGAAYEGAPGLVHGGVASMLMDQLLSESVQSANRPGFTGTMTVTYRKATPLGDLRAEAWIELREEYKTRARGHLIGPDGVTVEAEAVFVLPRWARETNPYESTATVSPTAPATVAP